MALKNNDLAAIAKQIGLGAEIKETTLFKRDDNPYDLGITQELRDQVFELKQINAIGKTVQHPQGYAVPKLIETQLPKPGEFALSKDQVEKDYVEAKAKELVQIDSKKLSDEAGKQKSLEKAAKSLGLSVKTSKPFNAAGTPGEDIGANPQFVQTASALPIDAVSAPIPMLDNYAVFQVKSRTPFDESAFQKQKSSLREGVLRSKQEPYFQEYVTNMAEKLEKDGKIQINKRVLDQIAASR